MALHAAHTYGSWAAFQPPIGLDFVSERLTFAQKEAPHEKKALTFFHADISFCNEDGFGRNMSKALASQQNSG